MKEPATCQPTPAAPSAARRWTLFLAGLLGIWLFAFVAVPAFQRLEPVREVRAAIERRGIDATALLYTETEVSGEAESAIRNALKYSPSNSRSP